MVRGGGEEGGKGSVLIQSYQPNWLMFIVHKKLFTILMHFSIDAEGDRATGPH